MIEASTFSERHGLSVPDAEIIIRYEAPDWLRDFVVRLAYEADLQPSTLRAILCDLLLEAPDRSNWSEFPNIDGEVHQLLNDAQWFQVYDFIEETAKRIHPARFNPVDSNKNPALRRFIEKLNEAFRRKGVGWQLVEGRVEVRGPESFESSVRTAIAIAENTGRSVAQGELHEALHDLSKRPSPDITGAIQHAMAALECVARDVAEDSKATLGEIIKRNPGLFPTPLDTGVANNHGTLRTPA